MLKVCHNSSVVGVPSGCSGILVPHGPYGPFNETMQIASSPTDCMVPWLRACQNSSVVGVPSGSPTDCMVQWLRA